MSKCSVFQLYATAAFGLEGLVSAELKRLNMKDIHAESGGVLFSGTADDAFLCNIRSRFCDRIYILLKQSICRSFEDLFQFVFSIPWENYTDGTEAYNVSAKCVKSMLMSQRDCQSITKKAIIEKLKATTVRRVFPESGAAFPVHVSIRHDIARLFIDTTGTALSRRGYRTWNGEAPIRETLASALVEMSPWRPGQPLYDPCCGTGTILIEAALREMHIAPGLYRPFSMENFSFCKNVSFDVIRVTEKEAVISDHIPDICGSDIDPAAVDLADRHIIQAGLRNKISVRVQALQDVTVERKNGVFICNPPYGERISDKKTCHILYHELNKLKMRHPSWSLCAISSDPEFERYFGKKADKIKRLYNGRLECNYYIYL